MNSRIRILTSLFVLLLLLGQCKQKYDSPYSPPVTGYLVVEGFIAGNAPTRFTLSRVIHLPGDSTIPVVRGAKVQVEGTDNSVYPLAESSPGVYMANTLPLNATVRYRLRIASDGDTYLSDTVAYKITPPIDSLTWTQAPEGVYIYANTHDPANATHYYQWQFQETWQYTAAEFSNYAFREKGGSNKQDTVTIRDDSEYIYNCWRSDASTPLLLGSSAKLAQDVIYRQKLQFIPRATSQISVLYSMIAQQYALTKEAYDFLSLMRSNTESLGSIFDAQPSQLQGNIHSLTHPDEQIIGFVSAGTVQQQRIFISRTDVPNWGYIFVCADPDTLVFPSKIDNFFSGGAYVPIDRQYGAFGFLGWSANGNYCVDCRLQGGTTKKPSFWPN